MTTGRLAVLAQIGILAVAPASVSDAMRIISEYYPSVQRIGIVDAYVLALSVAVMMVWVKIIVTGLSRPRGDKADQ